MYVRVHTLEAKYIPKTHPFLIIPPRFTLIWALEVATGYGTAGATYISSALCPGTSRWRLETGQGENNYTMEIGEHCRAKRFSLFCPVNIYQFTGDWH